MFHLPLAKLSKAHSRKFKIGGNIVVVRHFSCPMSCQILTVQVHWREFCTAVVHCITQGRHPANCHRNYYFVHLHKRKWNNYWILKCWNCFFFTSFINKSSACALVMFLLYHLWEDKLTRNKLNLERRECNCIYQHVRSSVNREIKLNSLKSLKVVAWFFSYVSTGYKACDPDEGLGKTFMSYRPSLYSKKSFFVLFFQWKLSNWDRIFLCLTPCHYLRPTNQRECR